MTRPTAAAVHTCDAEPGCPLTSSPPFAPPWTRALTEQARERIEAWCGELRAGGGRGVHIVEWVGPDTRVPQHAVVLSFPADDEPPAVIYVKVEDLQKHHLEAALGAR